MIISKIMTTCCQSSSWHYKPSIKTPSRVSHKQCPGMTFTVKSTQNHASHQLFFQWFHRGYLVRRVVFARFCALETLLEWSNEKRRKNGIWWGGRWWNLVHTIFSPFFAAQDGSQGIMKKIQLYSFFLYTCRSRVGASNCVETCMTNKNLMKRKYSSVAVLLLWWPPHVCSIVFDDSVSYPFSTVWFLFSPKKARKLGGWKKAVTPRKSRLTPSYGHSSTHTCSASKDTTFQHLSQIRVIIVLQ